MAPNMLRNQLVSICMPTYNTGKYIAAAIQSVVHQTYQNWELIIVNDGSTDDTKLIIETQFKDDRIRLININNSGAAAARNLAYSASKGKYIKFLDSDDLINPEMIEAQIALTENDNFIISATWGRFYNNDLSTFQLNPEDCWQTLTPVEWICNSWKYAHSMTTPGIFLIPKTIIEKAGLWDENLSLLDDTEYFTRTILAADKVIFSTNSTLYYRSGNRGSLSGQTSKIHAQSAYYSLLKSSQYLIAAQNNPATRLLSANSLQLFLYSIYPYFPALCRAIEKEIKDFGGSTIKWRSSGWSSVIEKAFGWKLAKKIQLLKQRIA